MKLETKLLPAMQMLKPAMQRPQLRGRYERGKIGWWRGRYRGWRRDKVGVGEKEEEKEVEGKRGARRARGIRRRRGRYSPESHTPVHVWMRECSE